MTVFITGASGFIGKYAVQELSVRGFKVIALSRNIYADTDQVHWIHGSLEDTESIIEQLENYSIDACIHLAWEGIPNYSYQQSLKNLQYGLQLLELCKKLSISTLIITGSCWEYDFPSKEISENHPLSYQNSFKSAKNALHFMAHAFCEENQIQLYWLRLFYVYGPGQRDESLIPYIVQTVLKGKQPVLSGANNQNDFIFVKDVAEAFYWILKDKPSNKIYNIGSGSEIPVLDVMDIIGEFLNVKIYRNSFKNNIKESIAFHADISRICSDTNWKPQTSLQQGIKEYIDAFKGM